MLSEMTGGVKDRHEAESSQFTEPLGTEEFSQLTEPLGNELSNAEVQTSGESKQHENGVDLQENPGITMLDANGISVSTMTEAPQDMHDIKFEKKEGAMQCKCDKTVEIEGCAGNVEQLAESTAKTFSEIEGTTYKDAEGKDATVSSGDIQNFQKVVQGIMSDPEFKNINLSQAMSSWNKDDLKNAIAKHADPNNTMNPEKMCAIAKAFQSKTPLKYKGTENGILAARAVVLQGKEKYGKANFVPREQTKQLAV